MSARKALGKGLGALIPGVGEEVSPPTGGFTCGVEEIAPSPRQPREGFDEARLKELADSIHEKGIVAPIIVRRAPEGASAPYEIVAGERRWRAAQKAGLDTVPVIIRELTDGEAMELALVENLQREDLNPIEEANAMKSLAKEFGLTQEEISRRVGIERSTVANVLRLLKLSKDIQKDIARGALSAGHARALLSIPEGELRNIAHKRIIQSELSVREAEKLAKKLIRSPIKKKSRISFPKDITENLSKALGTRTKIRSRGKGGVIEIYFGSDKELNRILDRILK